MRIKTHQLPPQRCTGQTLNLGLAPRRCQRDRGSGPQDFCVIPVSDDHPAGLRQEILSLKHSTIEMRGKAPIKTVTMIEVIGPFAITEQIGAADLDFHNNNLALGVDTHQVCPTV